jgi:hypothetical protein
LRTQPEWPSHRFQIASRHGARGKLRRLCVIEQIWNCIQPDREKQEKNRGRARNARAGN